MNGPAAVFIYFSSQLHEKETKRKTFSPYRPMAYVSIVMLAESRISDRRNRYKITNEKRAKMIYVIGIGTLVRSAINKKLSLGLHSVRMTLLMTLDSIFQ